MNLLWGSGPQCACQRGTRYWAWRLRPSPLIREISEWASGPNTCCSLAKHPPTLYQCDIEGVRTPYCHSVTPVSMQWVNTAQAMSSCHGAVKVLRLTANSRMCFSLKKIVILATVLTCTFCKLKLLKSITLFCSLCIDMWRQILKAEANNIFPWTTFLFNNRMNLF